MGLSLEAQWTLVAAGLIAHADHVMAGEECERLMALLDEHVEGDDYSHWLGIVSDPDELRARLNALSPPAFERHRELLEEAWIMAGADGVRAPEEDAMLAEIAQRLGVDAMQLEFWQQAWEQAQQDAAEATVRAAVHVLAGDDTLAGEDEARAGALLDGLPTTPEHRRALRDQLSFAHSLDDAGRRLAALPRARRRTALRSLAPLVADADTPEATDRFRALSKASGLGPAFADALLAG